MLRAMSCVGFEGTLRRTARCPRRARQSPVGRSGRRRRSGRLSHSPLRIAWPDQPWEKQTRAPPISHTGHPVFTFARVSGGSRRESRGHAEETPAGRRLGPRVAWHLFSDLGRGKNEEFRGINKIIKLRVRGTAALQSKAARCSSPRSRSARASPAPPPRSRVTTQLFLFFNEHVITELYECVHPEIRITTLYCQSSALKFLKSAKV